MAEKIFPESERLSDETIAKLRRLADEKTGMSQSDISRKTGIKQPAISAWLRHAQRPMAHQLVAVAKVVGASLDWLTDDACRAEDMTPGMPLVPPVESFVDRFASQSGLSRAEAGDVLIARIRRLVAEPESPRIKGNEKIEPVKRMKGSKAGNKVGARRPLGENKDA